MVKPRIFFSDLKRPSFLMSFCLNIIVKLIEGGEQRGGDGRHRDQVLGQRVKAVRLLQLDGRPHELVLVGCGRGKEFGTAGNGDKH